MNKPKFLPELNIQPYERYLPSAFDESMSILQKINKVIYQLNLIGEISNELNTQWNNLYTWVTDKGLTEAVNAEINERIKTGEFDELIYKIVGDIKTLETSEKENLVKALNEVFLVVTKNTENIGVIEKLETNDKTNLVSSINEIKRANDLNNQVVKTIGESTGYGVISGLNVRQQNVLAMAVEIGDYVTPNIVHTPDGHRHSLDSIAIPILPSDNRFNRIDLIYVNQEGVIAYEAGQNALNPIKPLIPETGVGLAYISIQATDTTVNNVDIEDIRPMKTLQALLTNDQSNFVNAINEIVNKVIKVSNDYVEKIDLGDRSDLKTDNQTTIVSAINELLTKMGANVDLTTAAKTTIVSAINELLTKMGENDDLTTTEKTTIVSAINELLTKMGANVDLTTTAKTTIVSAINELLTKMNENFEILSDENEKIEKTMNEKNEEIENTMNEKNQEIENTMNEKIGDIAALLTPDKTNIVSSINSLHGKVKNLSINVRDFGAKGDGITDDTLSIQHAIDSSSPYDTITFPRGIYVISDTLNIPINNLIIQGNAKILAKPNSTFETMMTINGRVGNKIYDLEFDANALNRKLNQVNRYCGLIADLCTDLTITNCTFRNTIGHKSVPGVGIGTSVGTRVTIESCHFIDCGGKDGTNASDGVYTFGNQTIISNCTAIRCTDTGFVLEASNNSIITGCTALECSVGAGITNFTVDDKIGNIIDGLVVRNWDAINNGGMQLGCLGEGTGNLINTLVSNVTIVSDKNSAFGKGPGIRVRSDGFGRVKKMVLSNIIIEGSTLSGMSVRGDDVSIIGCKITNTGDSSVGFDDAQNAVISSCHFEGANFGVTALNNSHVMVQSTTIKNNKLWGMYAFDTSAITGIMNHTTDNAIGNAKNDETASMKHIGYVFDGLVHASVPVPVQQGETNKQPFDKSIPVYDVNGVYQGYLPVYTKLGNQ